MSKALGEFDNPKAVNLRLSSMGPARDCRAAVEDWLVPKAPNANVPSCALQVASRWLSRDKDDRWADTKRVTSSHPVRSQRRLTHQISTSLDIRARRTAA